ncbi:glucose-6-phosphate dehydrogenase [Polymorphobacter fuscus]|uniref:Glucose-6-phosphate 1-dehydrogenase n=1 Tax=Sandarakinorhabdus fusca TaxID=1439888 RepID=A0A7C9KHY1_9SPHN|nr:glucose-6-phosphate dehydrogenase [Polymorphobacter fuscus]KAB7647575.1 glucose-6-phosphate dehydrogenase [Polymorphobacter fuscus]MQT16841.1 glucose-6-phosphate dehydrogenase [Polymorphobacter fuscus]NJC09170.1 glucose-6-phosphate 1-dehydrogenase [Polymorphobacter fuscus]
MTQPCTHLLLFGATGDLSKRMLLPSLFGLDADGLLPDSLRIIATARSVHDTAEFRALAAAALDATVDADRRHPDQVARFLDRITYVPLDASKAEGFAALAQEIGDTAHVAIFLSTAPSLFGPTIAGLSGAGLAGPGVRLALEKPLGSDLASSRQINDAVAAAYPEDRTFRIDHYLGKETVQNLIALRFGNTLFEPLWNAGGIDHVQISIAETVGLESRADYYDGMGALRDMVQNHMLQLLALVAMEPPARFDPTSVRDEKVKVLRSLRPIDRATVESHSVRGQYVAGAVDGQPVRGYAEELGRSSGTETFVALKAHVDNWRWQGVPFYLRTGKRLPERTSEIIIQFKPVPHSMFGDAPLKPNMLIIGLQPDENIGLTMMAKAPGLDRDGLKLRSVPLDIGINNAFADVRRRIAYERLLLDLIEGKQTLFVRRDEVEAQWTWIDAIRAGWAAQGMAPAPYAAGNWGPNGAIRLTERDGVSWHD